MDAHGVAGNLGNVLVGERDLVTAVTGTDEVRKVALGIQSGLAEDFLHGDPSGLFRVDLGFDGRAADDLAGLI